MVEKWFIKQKVILYEMKQQQRNDWQSTFILTKIQIYYIIMEKGNKQRIQRFKTDFAKYNRNSTNTTMDCIDKKQHKRDIFSMNKTQINFRGALTRSKKLKNKKLPINSSLQKHKKIIGFDILQQLGRTKVNTQQLLDQSFAVFLDEIKRKSGFRGALNTNSHSQLLYLTSQKRFQSSQKQLKNIKQNLYKQINVSQIIKNTHECTNFQHKQTNFQHKQNLQKLEQKQLKDTTQKNQNNYTSFIQYLTQYNPSHSTQQNQQQQSNEINKSKIIHNNTTKGKLMNSQKNVIRQKLKNYQNNSVYKSKLKNHRMLFQGHKFQG